MRNFTVAALIRHVELNFPQARGVEDENGRARTVREIERRSNRLANALGAQGIQKGGCVAYIGRNHLEFVEIDFALAKSGLVKVPIYFRLSVTEIQHIIESANVLVIIADSDEAERFDEASLVRGSIIRICLNDKRRRAGWIDYEDLIAGASEVAPKVRLTGSDLYQIRFTSGSTGQPKGCLTTHAAAREAILGNLSLIRQEGPSWAPRNLIIKPIVMAAGWLVLPTLLAGGTNVIYSQYEPERLIDQVVEGNITWLSVVPTMLRDLCRIGKLDGLRESKLECLLYGGEPASIEAIGQLSEVTDTLVQTYGQTEAPSYSAVLTREDHRHEERWRTIGRPIPRVTWATFNADDEIVDTPNVIGEFGLQSASITAGLLGAEEEYKERLIDDSWWLTGDVGSIDELGYITLVDRRKNMIISGGSNIYPVEIERVLEQHPGIREAVVFGVPDERWGERPMAVVYAPEPQKVDIAEVRSFVEERLARFKIPDRIEVNSEPLPRRGAEGKLWKEKVAEQFRSREAT